MYLKIGAYVKK